MANERLLYLNSPWITALFFYYFFVFLSGIALVLIALIPELIFRENLSVLNLSIIGSIGMASNGAAIFYIRKLYKLCFQEHLEHDNPKNTYIRRLGTIVYFIARPLFGIGFSILVIIGLQSGFMLTSKNPLELNKGFIYMSMFITFFVGFLSGRFVKQLEEYGEKVLNKVTK